jgi:hypothetical protein
MRRFFEEDYPYLISQDTGGRSAWP